MRPQRKAMKPASRWTGATTWLLPLLLLGALAQSVFVAYYYAQLPWDDSYITFRYARNFADGKGLVFNVGDHVEGYSNFSWLLILAGAYRLGFDIPSTAQALGAVFAVLTLVYSVMLARRYVTDPALAYASAFLPLVTYGFAVYAMSGLETIFFMFLLIAGLYHYLKNFDRIDAASTAYLALLALTRPEGALFAGLLILIKIAFLKKGFFTLRNISLVVLGFIPFGAYFLFRIAYFGELAPNSVIAKSCIGLVPFLFGIAKGIRYSGMYLAQPLTLILLIPIALSIKTIIKRKELLAACVFYILCVLAYTIYGGDWMMAYRLFLPLLPILIIASLACAQALASPPADRPRGSAPGGSPRTSLAILIVMLLILISATIADVNAVYFTDRIPASIESAKVVNSIGTYLKAHENPGDTLVFGGIGVIGYVSDITIRDTLGLVDRHIAHLPGCITSTDFGYGAQLYKQLKFDADHYYEGNPRYILIESYLPITDAKTAQSYELAQNVILRDARFANYSAVQQFNVSSNGYMTLFEYQPVGR